MSRILTLTKTMIKSQDNSMLPEKNKKTMIGLLIFVYLYLGSLVGYFSYYVIDMLNDMSQSQMSFYLLFTAISLYLIVMSFILVPSIYYFSKDIQRYLVLPISVREFMVARLLNTLYTLYISLGFIYIPFIIAYFAITGFSLNLLIAFIIAGLFIPLIPMVISLAVVVIVFKFVPLFRNKNLFTYISTLFILAITMVTSMMGSSNMDPDAMIESLIEGIQTGTNTLVNVMSTSLPHLRFFIDGVANLNFVSLLIGILVSLAFVAIAILLIENLYVKSALSIQEESGSRKKLSDKELVNRSRSNSLIVTLMKNDFRNIMRTPIFALNYFIMLLILPIMIFLPLFTSPDILTDLGPIIAQIKELITALSIVDGMIIALCGTFLVSFAFGSLGMVASTAISREGKAMSEYKIMPINLITLVNAKLILSVICMSLPLFFVIIIAGVLLRLNPLIVLLAFVSMLIGSLCSNIFNIYLDVYKPKLNWTIDQEAVKQNMLAMVPMFSIMAIIGVIVISALNFGVIIVLMSSTLIIVAISALLYVSITKMCQTRLPRLIG